MVLLFIASLGVLLITLYIHRDWSHPVVLMFGVWTFILLLYLLQIVRVIPPTIEIIAVLSVMLFGFLLGVLCYSVVHAVKMRRAERRFAIRGNILTTRMNISSSKLNRVSSDKKLREALFFVFCIVSIAVMFVDQIKVIQSVIGGASFSDIIRDAGGADTVEISGTIRVGLYIFVVHPMTACVSPVCAIEILTRDKGRLKYLIINFIVVFLAVFHHGGRNAIIVMGICYLVSYAVLRKERINISRKIKVAFGAGMVLASVIVFSLSSSRGIQDIWLSFYAYFIADIPLGQQYLAVSHFLIEPTLGFFSLKGLFYPLFSVLQFFGIQAPELYNMASTMGSYIETNILSIGDYTMGLNAFIPAGAYPYIDGGYVFEFIFMFLYGFVSNYLYCDQKEARGKKKAIYVMWAYGLILSFCRLYFTSYSYFIGLLWMVFVLYGIRKDNPSPFSADVLRKEEKR